MNYKEENLGALTDLINKMDSVQIDIETLLSCMEFDDNSPKDSEAESKLNDLVNRFTVNYKSNRDKFVLKMISVLETMD
jgi:hypothetical protein